MTNSIEQQKQHRYTPHNEHFGIVPLECMSAGRPVIAVNSGGPTETVVNDVTGYLCDAENPKQWAECMESLRIKKVIVLDLSKKIVLYGKKFFTCQPFKLPFNFLFTNVATYQNGNLP